MGLQVWGPTRASDPDPVALSERVLTSKPLRASTPRSAVRPSVRAYSPACLCRCLGPVHRWDRTECRGGRSSKRPTQFQAGSQLLLVLRRSAENERRKRAACAWCVAAVWSPPGPDPGHSGQPSAAGRTRGGTRRRVARGRNVDVDETRYDEVGSCGFEGSRGPVNSGAIQGPARCETVHRETRFRVSLGVTDPALNKDDNDTTTIIKCRIRGSVLVTVAERESVEFEYASYGASLSERRS